jgi:hypothetical protein
LWEDVEGGVVGGRSDEQTVHKSDHELPRVPQEPSRPGGSVQITFTKTKNENNKHLAHVTIAEAVAALKG